MKREACRSRQARPGLTLLEVIIALAIFLFSLATLIHLLSLSGDRALETNLRTQAGLLCQTKLAEVVAGIEKLGSTGYTPFPENPDYQYRVECDESDISGLWMVQVWVKKDRHNDAFLEVSLSQMVFDPSQRGSTQDTPGLGAMP